MSCCSNRAITFHYVSPQMMMALEYLIYHVTPYGKDSNLWQENPANSTVKAHVNSSNPTTVKSIPGINSKYQYH